MASGVRPRQTANGQVTSSYPGPISRQVTTSTANSTGMSLPVVDPEDLKARLYSYAPQKAPVNTRAFYFKKPTNTQLKKSSIASAPRLEPLPGLQKHQERNRPEYIQKKAWEKLEAEGTFKDEPDVKRKRPDSVEPMDHAQSASPLPDLPEDLKQRQEALGSAADNKLKRTPTPPKDKKKKSPRGKSQTPAATARHAVKTTIAPKFLGLTDMEEMIRLTRQHPENGFMYLSPAVSKSSVKSHYYNLKVVDHEHANKSDHCTMSLKGVTRMRSDDETEFVPLDRWEQEYKYFQQLIKIKTFAQFRMWKAFSVWRQNVKSKKLLNCKKALNEDLFIVNPSLRPALLNVREMCFRIGDMGLCKVEKGRTYTLYEFREAQFRQLSEVAGRLDEFRDLVKEVVRSACRTALLEAGFTPDDYFFDGMDSPGLYPGEGVPRTASSYLMQSNYDMDIYAEAPDKMTYTEQANKRSHCKRLTCFIRLADYLIVNTMHVLAVNSVSTMLNYLSEQLQNTPTLADIQGWNKEVEAEEETESADLKDKDETSTEKEEDTHILPPLFLTEFGLEPNQLSYHPDEEEFQDGLLEVTKRYQDCVLSVQPLVPDNYFDAFTRPIINNKFEEKTCGDGPSLVTMFDDDKHLQGLVQNLKEAVAGATNATNQYADTFEPYREFYKENESLDLDAVRQQEHDVSFFAESLARYHKQHKMAEAILEKRAIGMLLVDAIKKKKVPTATLR